MATYQVINKLGAFLKKGRLFTQESQVVYFMVGIRKILDNENDVDFSLVRFYCDWTVHTKKDMVTSVMKKIIRQIYSAAKLDLETPAAIKNGPSPISDFIYMEHLKKEVNKFIIKYSISSPFNTPEWGSFAKLLIKVLESQPIVNPIKEVSLLSFIPYLRNTAQMELDFSRPVGSYRSYQATTFYGR